MSSTQISHVNDPVAKQSEYDYETFSGGIETRYSSQFGLEVIRIGFNCKLTDIRVFLAGMRDVWPVIVPAKLANEFSEFPTDCWRIERA